MATRLLAMANEARRGSRVFLAALTLTSCGVTGSVLAGVADDAYLVSDIRMGSMSSFPNSLTSYKSRLYFLANDNSSGYEPWTSDGQPLGTYLFLDAEPGFDGSFLRPVGVVDGQLFLATEEGQSELWVSDGTPEGTELVSVIPNGVRAEWTEASNLLFFRKHDLNGSELWRSDGTAVGTFGLDLVPGPGSSVPRNLMRFGDQLVLTADHLELGTVVYITDGSEPGTRVLHDYDGEALGVAGKALYFRGYSPGFGQVLWIAEGSGRETRIVSTKVAAPSEFVELGQLVLFTGFSLEGRELWRTDGTEAGTVLVMDINQGNESSNPFFAEQQVSDLDGQVVFSADDGIHGAEPWTTDGTPEGTRLLLDINPGDSSSSPSRFFKFRKLVYFTAANLEHGTELWRTDGTPEGTEMIELRLGPEGSVGWEPFIEIGETLFVVADDGKIGRELWAVGPPLFADGFESGDTSAWSSTVP